MIDIWSMTDTENAKDESSFLYKLMGILGKEEKLKLELQSNELLDIEACVRQQKVSVKILQILRIFFQNECPKSNVFAITFLLVQANKLNNILLMKHLIEAGYTEKTANAQAHQMTKALSILKVVKEESRGQFTNNKDSILLPYITENSWSVMR